jgi:two-component system chemotaxis response regulator CheY
VSWVDMSFSEINVLLVDDSKAMRDMVRRTLLRTGFSHLHVREAENGSEALAQLANGEPDIILSDWRMPEMNGVELLRELRARGSAVKFGFITSEAATEPMREKAFEAGAQFILERPFSVQRFCDILRG